ncbi:MAG: DUF4012 domain-containing protein [Microbacterium sp.]|uniref:DUF4012 domain-containing protein n=1 Tax=Microbacterium sp. TaxID=51671 RepID=UPI003BB11326
MYSEADISAPTEEQKIGTQNRARTRREAGLQGALADLDPALDSSDGVDDGDGEAQTGRHGRRRWPWILLAIVIVLIAVGAVAAVFARQALEVRDDLQEAKEHVSRVVPLVKAGDVEGVTRLSEQILKLTTSADKTVSNPLWDAASSVPWVGVNVAAVRETTQATHVLVRDALPLAMQLIPLADVKGLKVEGGGVNLEPFRAAALVLPTLREAFAEAKSHIDRIDRDEILPYVEENIGQIIDIVDDAAPALAFAEKNLPRLLSVLGGDGPRSYVLLFQNNAEIRATGGNPGSSAILTVNNGKVEMRQDADALRFAAEGPSGNHPQVIHPAEKAAIFEPDTVNHSQNYTRTPDFADTAVMVNGLWSSTVGGQLDGVISLDPVVLSYLLSVAGPVEIAGEAQSVTAENAVKLLLSDTYERFGSDGPASDAYFSAVSASVFRKVMSGGWDPLLMFEQLTKSVDEQRIYTWFLNPEEQAMAAELNIDGAVTSTNDAVTQTGIYLNDASHSKLEYYLATTMSVTCSAADRTMTTSITMANAAPSTPLSSYTIGHRNRRMGYAPTTMLLDVIGMSLPGGALASTSPGNGDLEDWDRSGIYNGRETKSLLIVIPRGESRTVSFTSTIPEGAAAPLEVRYTPTVVQTPVTVDAACGTMFPAKQ